MDRELLIKLMMDRSQAERSGEQFHEGERRRIDATVTHTDQAARQIGNAHTHAANQARTAHTQFTREASDGLAKVTQSASGTTTAITGMGTSATGALASIVTSAGLAQMAFQKVLDVLNQVGEAIEKAAEKQRALTREFAETSDDLTELADLMGRLPGKEFTLEMARFGTTTGMKPEESKRFLTDLYNAGAAQRGRNISGEQFDVFAQQAAQLSVARHYKPEDFGLMAGTILGQRNYARFGQQASSRAMADLDQAMAILQHGKGDSAVLARQFSMLTSAMLNEDPLQAVFQDVHDAAIALSIAAEKHDAQASELTIIAGRALRGFGPKDKQAELLKQAGVTPMTGFLEAIERIGPQVQMQAMAQGVKPIDILNQYFQAEEAQALSVFLTKGIAGGGFAERRQFAAGIKGPEAAIAAYQATFPGMTRMEAARTQEEQMRRGAEMEQVNLIQMQAVRELQKERLIDTTASNLQNWMMGRVAFGMMGSGEQTQINKRAAEILLRRTPEGAAQPAQALQLPMTPEFQTMALERQIEAIQAAGGDPFHALGAVGAEAGVPGAVVPRIPVPAARPGQPRPAAGQVQAQGQPRVPAPIAAPIVPGGRAAMARAPVPMAPPPPPPPAQPGITVTVDNREVVDVLRQILTVIASFVPAQQAPRVMRAQAPQPPGRVPGN